jgi:hypothetical protein
VGGGRRKELSRAEVVRSTVSGIKSHLCTTLTSSLSSTVCKSSLFFPFPPFLPTSHPLPPRSFWQHALNVAEEHEDDFKHQALPLARIKKVAKMDPEVQVRFRFSPMLLPRRTVIDRSTYAYRAR